jgi:hypothetical protein
MKSSEKFPVTYFANQRATPSEQRPRNGHAIEKVGAVSQ